jgi:hypothetical protein
MDLHYHADLPQTITKAQNGTMCTVSHTKGLLVGLPLVASLAVVFKQIVYQVVK